MNRVKKCGRSHAQRANFSVALPEVTVVAQFSKKFGDLTCKEIRRSCLFCCGNQDGVSPFCCGGVFMFFEVLQR